MHSFPRLMTLFGGPGHALTAEQIADAIAKQVPEAEDLDWKQELYSDKTEGRQELAKDIAALANAGGGILVIGVEDQDSAAHASMPVALSAAETERMQKISQYGIRPFLPGVRITPVPLSSGEAEGYYVISVPRSPDAPHAVARGGDGTILSWPVRDGQTTRYLHEPEIARRYRDRFTSRAELTAALDMVHREGADRRNPDAMWLMLSLYPSAPGTQHHVGSATIRQITTEVQEWAKATAPLPGANLFTDPGGYPAVRRAVVIRPGGIEFRLSSLNRAFAELHFNGAGFAAVPCPYPAQRDGTSWPELVAQDLFEVYLLVLVLLLSGHAAASGAGGDCELQAEIRLAADPYMRMGLGRATTIYAPTTAYIRGPVDEYEQVNSSTTVSIALASMRTTASLDELTDSKSMVVQTAHTLATDILGQFAVADTCVLRADGGVETGGIYYDRAPELATWAAQNGVVTT